MNAVVRPRALIADALVPRAAEILEAGGVAVTVAPKIAAADLLTVLGDYDALLVRSRTQVTADVFAAAPRLAIVARAGVGVDNIDVRAATRRGVVVVNAPEGNTVTTAEHALALMMALARSIPQATASMKAGKWEKTRFVGTQLAGATLGVLGFGHIGRVVAERGVALGMRVLVYDPYVAASTVADVRASAVPLDELLAAADFVSVHVPFTRDTRGLLGAAAFARMKPGARLIHCARGGIVDEAALVAALRAGQLAGAALDVFETEPPPCDHPLLTLDNVIVTPHLGASTTEAQEGVALQVAEDVVRFFETGSVANPVNAPSVPSAARGKLAPYIEVAERLGAFLAQTSPGGVERIGIQYAGRLLQSDTALIRAAVVKGLLACLVDQPVNEVNALLLAEERGLVIEERHTGGGTGAYRTLLSVEAARGAERRSAAATVFPDGGPRIVRVDNLRVELAPVGHILILGNHDRPGVVGGVGTLLGRHAVNIGHMQVGQDPATGAAYSFWMLDKAVPEAVMGEIRGLPNVLTASQVLL